MTCDEVQKKLPFFAVGLIGELNEEEVELIRQHMKTCAVCQNEYNLYKQSMEILRQWPDVDVKPPKVLIPSKPVSSISWKKIWKTSEKVLDMVLRIAAVLFLIAFGTGKIHFSATPQPSGDSSLAWQKEIMRNRQLLLQLIENQKQFQQGWQTWILQQNTKQKLMFEQVHQLQIVMQQQQQQEFQTLLQLLENIHAENRYTTLQTIQWVQTALEEKQR